MLFAMLNLFMFYILGYCRHHSVTVPVHAYLIVLPHTVLYMFTFLICETVITKNRVEHIAYNRIAPLTSATLSDDLHRLVDIPSRRRLRCSSTCRALIVVLLVTERSLLTVRRSGTVCHTTLLTVCHWHHSFLFFYIISMTTFFLFSGPWGFYLGHFKNFLCICMYLINDVGLELGEILIVVVFMCNFSFYIVAWYSRQLTGPADWVFICHTGTLTLQCL